MPVTERGVALAAGTAPEVVAATAALAEELGYRSFWLNHPGQRDGVAGLEPAAGATSRIDLGVGVVPIHLRPVESVVAVVEEVALPVERLLLGIGTAGPGAYRLAREGAAELRLRLGCRVVMAALSEGACRVAGEVADGVLLNWLTPDHARRSAEWVEHGAAKAGRPRPPLYAYLRVALGAGARERLEAEGARYTGVATYASHFERMGAAPAETAVAADDADAVAGAVAAWDGVVDQVLLRLLPSSGDADAHEELVRAGAPGGRPA